MNLLLKAVQFAIAAHDSINQKRKYTGEPYWHHVLEVAEIVSRYTQDEKVIVAALGHDCLEDVAPKNPEYNYYSIVKNFGFRVGSLVQQLTDKYTKEAFPNQNRATRKKLEAVRLGTITNDAKLIKLADIISNTKSIVKHDPNFAKTYLKEKEELLPYLAGVNDELFAQAAANLTL